MSIFSLTQAEIDGLIALEKAKVDDEIHEFPDQGGTLRIPLTSMDRRENFMLDVTRGRIKLLQGTFQNRARQSIVLVRLDIFGPTHRNPDEEEIPCPHLHLFREGYGDKWASRVENDGVFSNLEDQWQTLLEFMNFCNIAERPRIRAGLFTDLSND